MGATGRGGQRWADPTASALGRWMASRGWTPFPFQEEVWRACREGQSGLLHGGTGSGKTLAAAGTALEELAEVGAGPRHPLALLWITPLRALARDTAGALETALRGMGVEVRVELRTGDASPALRARQRRALPGVLVTTPESLSLLLTYADTREAMTRLRTVVVDEWHELLGSRRGVQVELALARLRRWRPELRVWGLSATLGNPQQAMEVLLPGGGGRRVEAPSGEPPEVETLLPPDLARFPRAGHLGLALLPGVLDRLDEGGTTLLFTNTRFQAESWFQAILEARPRWKGEVALHHGSLDRRLREEVEAGVRLGRYRVVVCTSTLDLGVDFAPVDRVIQVGSPRGVARLLQRAGRSGHRPGVRSRVLCVPTHALEVAEFGAAREAILRGRLEPRRPLEAPIDVLAQHLVTVALGGGFREEELLEEIRSTHAFRDLTPEAWTWALDFVSRGGAALRAYPRYARVVRGEDGIHGVESREIARMHRASVGTITSDADLEVRWLRGGRLGRVEESFLSRLRPGDHFRFAGRTLELVRIRDGTAWVRNGGRGAGIIPKWTGGRLPLSSELASAVVEFLSRRGASGAPSAEEVALAPLLELQARWSRVPEPGGLVVERIRSREGHHLFLYPFEGRGVHEGMAALLAFRITRGAPRTVRVSATDHGLELLSPDPFPSAALDQVLGAGDLVGDLEACINAAELARRRFREIARVAGLLFQGYPGREKGTRQLQASGELLFDVLERYDPGSLLLEQARREVFQGILEGDRLGRALERAASARRLEAEPPCLTPFAFPIWAERIQAEVSTEDWLDRVRRMEVQLERAASRGSRRGGSRRGAGAAAPGGGGG